MNGDLTNTEAQHFAARILEEVGPNTDRQVERAFWLALGRPASEKEKADSRTMLARFSPTAGLTQLGVVLFNLNEFLYLE